jgi:thiol-disulfide isomerase/thioredoxin
MSRIAWLLLLPLVVGCAEGYSKTTTPAEGESASTEAAPCPFCAAGSKAAAIAAAGEQAAGDTAAEASSTKPAGEIAPVDLTVLDHTGIEQLVASKQGQVVVLDCWSTSCPTCMKEFPNLVRLQQSLGDKVACISLSFDYQGLGTVEEAMPPVREFLTQQQATFDNVISNVESDELYKQMEIISIPAVFVYDREGKLAKKFVNDDAKTEADAFTYAQVEDLVRQLLE